MKRYKLAIAGAVLLVAFTVMTVLGRDDYNLTREFPAKSAVKINTISGSCVIKRGDPDKIIVEIDASYRPSSHFEPRIEEQGNKLVINEELLGSTQGECRWTITVPEKTKISFSTASGSFEASDLDSKISINTASGSITLGNCKGELDASTASGELDLTNMTGEIHATTASGDIKAKSITGSVELTTASGSVKAQALKGEMNISVASGNIVASEISPEGSCNFSAASGDAEVTLAASPNDEFSVSSASGRAVLDYNGIPLKGHFELTACIDPHPGHIKAPFKFEKEEEFTRGDQDYITKSFTRENRDPLVTIETSSGEAVLEE